MGRIDNYVKDIVDSYHEAEGNEMSYRVPFYQLMKSYFDEEEKVKLLQEVRVKDVYGTRRPDFVVFNKDKKVLGALETKNIGKRLSDGRYKKQIADYSRYYPLLFTNYNDIQLIIEGRVVFEVEKILTSTYEGLDEDIKRLVSYFLALASVHSGKEEENKKEVS